MTPSELSSIEIPKLPQYVVLDVRSEVEQFMLDGIAEAKDIHALTEQVIHTFMMSDTLEGHERPIAELWRLPNYHIPITPAQRERDYNRYCDYFHGVREKLIAIGMGTAIVRDDGFNYAYQGMRRNATLLVLKHLEN